MKKTTIFSLAYLLLTLSATQVYAQVGAAVGSAAGRAAVISIIHALEEQRFHSREYPSLDRSGQFKVIQPDFRSNDFDMAFWYGAPVKVGNLLLPDGKVDYSVIPQLAHTNYNTWHTAVGPFTDPLEYAILREKFGKTVLTRPDSMQVLFRTLVNIMSSSTLQNKIAYKIPPQVATNDYPVSRYEPKTGRQQLLYFSLFLYWVVSTFGIWHIFYKADCRPKGYAFIPFWRIAGLCRVAGFQPTTALWVLVPGVNLIFWAILHIRLCQKFGVPGWFGLLSLVLPPALWWIIGRSEDIWYRS